MKTSRIIVMAIIAVIGAVPVGRLMAQSDSARPAWEVLVRTPLAADSDPVISLNGLTMPEQPVPEHSHPGVTIGYIVEGEIENQVEPNPLAVYKPGGFFSEAPGQLHKAMRNLSAEPAKLLIFHAGRAGVPAALLKALPGEPTKLSFSTSTQWQVPVPSTRNQELRLLRLTLPPGSRAEAATHSGPGLIYVVEGTSTIMVRGGLDREGVVSGRRRR